MSGKDWTGDRTATWNPLPFLTVVQSVSCDRGQVSQIPRSGTRRFGSSYTRAPKHCRASPSSASPGWTDWTDPLLLRQVRPHSACRCLLWNQAHQWWRLSQDVWNQRRILIDFQEKVVAWLSGGCSWRCPRYLWTHWSHVHCSHDTDAQSHLEATHQILV